MLQLQGQCAKDEAPDTKLAELQATIDSLFARLDSEAAGPAPSSQGVDCTSASGVGITAGRVASTDTFVQLHFDRCVGSAFV